jgi:hypothetical protein
MDRTFYIIHIESNSKYRLAFVNGGPMPSADEVSSLALSLLQVRSTAMTWVLHQGFVSICSGVFLDLLLSWRLERNGCARSAQRILHVQWCLTKSTNGSHIATPGDIDVSSSKKPVNWKWPLQERRARWKCSNVHSNACINYRLYVSYQGDHKYMFAVAPILKSCQFVHILTQRILRS